MSILMKPEAIA